MNLEKIFDYTAKPLTAADIPAMLSLCAGNENYYKYINSYSTAENLKETLEIFPEGKSLADKIFVGLWNENELVAMIDLIENYPSDKTAYIGWFIIDVKYQHRGIGYGIFLSLEKILRTNGFSQMGLAYADGNKQSEKFWEKCGFHAEGGKADMGKYTAVRMKKRIL